MATLIKGRRIATESASSPEQGEVLRLEPTDDPASVADRLERVARVEVNFPRLGATTFTTWRAAASTRSCCATARTPKRRSPRSTTSASPTRRRSRGPYRCSAGERSEKQSFAKEPSRDCCGILARCPRQQPLGRGHGDHRRHRAGAAANLHFRPRHRAPAWRYAGLD